MHRTPHSLSRSYFVSCSGSALSSSSALRGLLGGDFPIRGLELSRCCWRASSLERPSSSSSVWSFTLISSESDELFEAYPHAGEETLCDVEVANIRWLGRALKALFSPPIWRRSCVVWFSPTPEAAECRWWWWWWWWRTRVVLLQRVEGCGEPGVETPPGEPGVVVVQVVLEVVLVVILWSPYGAEGRGGVVCCCEGCGGGEERFRRFMRWWRLHFARLLENQTWESMGKYNTLF